MRAHRSVVGTESTISKTFAAIAIENNPVKYPAGSASIESHKAT